MICHLDIESYSEENLKKAGLYKYAEHLSTEIMVICYTFGKGSVNVWIPWGAEEWQWEEFPEEIVQAVLEDMEEKDVVPGAIYVQPECPEDLIEHAESGGQFRAHNSQFERTMLNGRPGQKIGFPHTEIHQWVCTAAKAAAHSLPRALENAATALDTHGKDKVGKQDMLACCKPRTGKVKRWTPLNAPERFIAMFKYCCDDVRAERGIDEVIPDLSEREQKVFELDQRINDRGIRVDIDAVHQVQTLIDMHKTVLENRCRELTGGIKPTQTEKLANWIRSQGFPIENLQAPVMKEALKLPEMEDMPEVRKVLAIRLLHSMKAVAKYDRMDQAVTADQRLHGMFLYHGAGTGRWSSMIVQLQNLFRPVIKDPEVAIIAFEELDLDYIKMLYDPIDPMKVFASCVRGMLIPDEGKDLMAMDFSAVEARGIAWLAGQEDILDVFRDHGKIYEYTAAKIYRDAYPGGASLKDLLEMEGKHWMRRFVGKIAVLALGYQGGKGAFAKMAKQYGVEVSEEEAEQIKVDWRAANPKIVQLWYDLERAAIEAVENPGTAFAIPNKKIIFKKLGQFLYMRLPSGRRLAYFKPRLDGEGKLTYLGIDTYTRRWMRCKTYGGKLAENATQAMCRDLLVGAMFRLEKEGYDIVGTVHDEVILEILEGFGSEAEVREIMCQVPKWAEGFPIGAAGFRAKRYRK